MKFFYIDENLINVRDNEAGLIHRLKFEFETLHKRDLIAEVSAIISNSNKKERLEKFKKYELYAFNKLIEKNLMQELSEVLTADSKTRTEKYHKLINNYKTKIARHQEITNLTDTWTLDNQQVSGSVKKCYHK